MMKIVKYTDPLYKVVGTFKLICENKKFLKVENLIGQIFDLPIESCEIREATLEDEIYWLNEDVD